MARLASIEKAGYFPCPTNVVQTLVLRHIRLHPWAVAPTYILDSCAGEGSAVHTFAQALARWRASLPTSTMVAHYADMAAQCQRRIHVRAVEIDAERAKAAKALLGEQNVVHSAIESVSAVGQFGIVWFNPPYDHVAGGRAELLWLRMCAPFVGESGMLVLIVPDMFVGTGRYAREMASALYQAGFGSSLVLRFPDPGRAQDLERLRERALLREFRTYVEGRGRLKVFRSEAVRAGFGDAWRRRDYAVIVAVAQRLPERVVQEDADLLMYYDNALMRMEGNSG
jgi:hypothetical protein